MNSAIVLHWDFFPTSDVLAILLLHNRSCSLSQLLLPILATKVSTMTKANMVYLRYTMDQHGHCATVPEDLIEIIPALHNKSEHSFSFRGIKLKHSTRVHNVSNLLYISLL